MIYVKIYISIELMARSFMLFCVWSSQRCTNVLMYKLLIHYAAWKHKHNFSKRQTRGGKIISLLRFPRRYFLLLYINWKQILCQRSKYENSTRGKDWLAWKNRPGVGSEKSEIVRKKKMNFLIKCKLIPEVILRVSK